MTSKIITKAFTLAHPESLEKVASVSVYFFLAICIFLAMVESLHEGAPMKWLSDLLAKLFGKKKPNEWDEANYGKPSDAGDDFRDRNQA